MEEVVKILMKRDNLSHVDAVAEVESFLIEAEEYIQEGDLDSIEELLMSDLGLEPDYLEMLLPGTSFLLF